MSAVEFLVQYIVQIHAVANSIKVSISKY